VSLPSALEVVAFDLDNTLYDEGLWFDAALPPIAAYLAARCGGDAGAVRSRLHAVLRANGKHYHHLFDDVMTELGLDPRAHLQPVLGIFREAPRRIELFAGMRGLLDDLAARYRLGLITSGQHLVQRRKIELLGIGGRFAAVVFSSTLPENKPGRMPFEHLLDTLGVEAGRAAYVGDNPLFDFRGANELGMLTVRLRNPEFDGLDVPEGWDARVRVEGAAELRALLL
jgi:FMN phosphatase YigB (HAD superfamily)